jgi:hypothetical protein
LDRAFGPIVPPSQFQSHVPNVVAPASVASKQFSVVVVVDVVTDIAIAISIGTVFVATAIVATGIGVLESARPKKVAFVYGK